MSNLIPQTFLDDLLNRVDLVELVDGYVPLKKQGNSFVACCPFHNEKSPSFHVVAAKQFYYCFGCGASGNAISFMMEYLQHAFPEAVEVLAARVGLEVPRERNASPSRPTENFYELLAQVARFYEKCLRTDGHEAIKYLKNRHLTGEIAKRFQLGYAPSGWHTLDKHFKGKRRELISTGMLIEKEQSTYDRYRDRIMFPIHDRKGRIIGFGGRVLHKDQQPKYLNSPETSIFQKNRELYGLHTLLQQDSKPEKILVVEGYMDVIALAQQGINYAVATLGTATSAYHIQLLSRHTSQIIFAFDGDNAGKKAAWRALENSMNTLNDGLDARFLFLPEGHDPDSLVNEEGQAAFENRLKKAIPLNVYFFSILTHKLDLSSLSGKSQLLKKASPFLLKMPDGAYKQLLLDEIARLTRLDQDRIQQLLAASEQTPDPKQTQTEITRTPTRVAIALLLQHPTVLHQCQIEPNTLRSIQEPVVQHLVQQILTKPEITTAQLIEEWREKKEFNAILKLASWQHQVPENALVSEFREIIEFLANQNSEQLINHLIEKSRNNALSEQERQELQRLLQQRHAPM